MKAIIAPPADGEARAGHGRSAGFAPGGRRSPGKGRRGGWNRAGIPCSARACIRPRPVRRTSSASSAGSSRQARTRASSSAARCRALVAAAATPSICAPVGTCLFVPDAADRSRRHAGDLVHRLGEPLRARLRRTAIGRSSTAARVASGRWRSPYGCRVKVIVTCGTNEKCARAIELGAEGAINYREQDFVRRCTGSPNATRVDVIVDMVGGDYLPTWPRDRKEGTSPSPSARRDGRDSDRRHHAAPAGATGSTLRPRSIEFKRSVADDCKDRVALCRWRPAETGHRQHFPARRSCRRACTGGR